VFNMAGARKQARSPKRGSTGAVLTVTPGTTGDYVDYTRIPFDLNSPENKIRAKKMSVSGTTVGTRKESVTAQLPVVAAETEDPLGWEVDARGSGAAASADGLDGVNLQAYMNQMTTHTHSNNQDVDLGTGQGERAVHAGAPSPRPTSSTNRVPFPRITHSDMNDSRPPSTPGTSHAPSRQNVRTPTLGEHAHRLQQTTPLPPPQPNYIAEQQYKAVEAAVNDSKGTAAVISSAGLKHLLQRNIEASAMAVYQLQDQQQPQRQPTSPQSQRRPRTRDAEATIAGLGATLSSAASPPTAAHPPARLRPSLGYKARTARQQPSPQNKHKPAQVDWSNHPLLSSGQTLAPTVMSASANLPSGTGAVTAVASGQAGHTWAGGSTQMQTDSPARGHLPQQGNLDLQAMFPSAKSSSAYDDRAAVVRQPSPAHTESASAVSRSSEQNPFSDMLVAGRKRNIETNREKVTNATLFM
jgi:hypothetical protein